MAFLIQHGHGKSEKIENALNDGVDGVILGAKHEAPEKLSAYLDELTHGYECHRLFDPQFFVSTLVPPNEGHLSEYPYFRSGLSSGNFTLRKVRAMADDVLRFQDSLSITAMISPTVIFDSFNDRWAQIALNLADASLEAHTALSNPKPLLLAFHFSEQALSSHDDVGRFLDTVTQDGWDMHGFYLALARHDSEYTAGFESDRLANLLYIANVLGRVNGLQVVFGYADFCGLPIRGAGASAFAGGWHQSQRRFLKSKFLQRTSTGGQPPRPRYASAPLLTSILVSELRDIYEIGMLNDVLSGTELDEIITSDPDAIARTWNGPLSHRQHFQCLKLLDSKVGNSVQSNLKELRRRIADAQALYANLESLGISFDSTTDGAHLAEWDQGITTFAGWAGFAV
ncbi:MAG: hypothetical protein JNK76_08515 [Planctomycetales bacterium]|nr:hypothetical protein [Planctomycetales bacterium]